MAKHSDKAREVLLDAAEELFACHGIDAVSNRRITERAGTANHSAINYHFGGRDQLLRALIKRHLEKMRQRYEELFAALGTEPALWDVIACRVLPWTELLAAQPLPGWRARFLFQVSTIPSVVSVLTAALTDNVGFERLSVHIRQLLADIPGPVLKARSGILGPMVLSICSDYEQQVQDGTAEGDWASVGYFLIDAMTGMLAAPVTRGGHNPPPPSPSGIL